MSPIRALIFDLDGTLIDSAIAITTALNQLLRQRGLPPVEKNRMRRLVSLGAADLVRQAMGEALVDVEADIAAFRALYRAMPPDAADLFPNVASTLATLQERGYKLGICTNKPEDLARYILDGVGLTPLLSAIIGGRPDLPPKPHPAMLQAAMQTLAVTASETLYIGDSETDAETAAAAGVPFTLVTYGYAIGDVAAIACDRRIGDVGELLRGV